MNEPAIVAKSRTELHDDGLTAFEIRAGMNDHALMKVARGCFWPDRRKPGMDDRIAALSRVLGPHKIVCDRTAAWIYGVDLFGFSEKEVGPRLEFCVRRGGTRSRRPEVAGLSRDLLDSDIGLVHNLAVTTPLRTALDIGCLIHKRDALGGLDQLCRLGLVSPPELESELPRFRGRRGVVQLRALVPLIDPRAESIRESWVRLALYEAGLPAPIPQFWVTDYIRVDLAYPRSRVAVEYDGFEFHLRTPEQQKRDAARLSELRSLGWSVVVVRNGDFRGRRLDTWISEIAGCLRGRAGTNRRWPPRLA